MVVFSPATRGILWALLATFCFAAMGILLKQTHERFTFHAMELVFWRMFPALLVLGFMAWRQQKRFVTPYAWRHLGRSVSGVVSMMLYFYAVAVLPLSVAVSLSYSSSIFLAIWSWLLLGERASVQQQSALGLGLLGVMVLLQPEWSGQSWLGMTAALLSSMLAGLAYFQLHQLGKLSEPAWRTVFYMSLIGTIFSAVLSTFYGWHALSWASLPFVLGISALAFIGQIALTSAYAVGKKETVSVLSYLTVVVSALWAYFAFDEVLMMVQYAGILLVVLSGTISALPKR